MKLFQINEQFEVELNKEWILLVPEFAALVKRDKGSAGDYRGDKKLKAKRELAYVYFMEDFASPIRDWDQPARKTEALKYTSLKPDDIDPAVLAAQEYYAYLLEESSRSLKTLKALRSGLASLDDYFQNVDFTKVDKQGKIMYTPEMFMANVAKLPKMREAIRMYETAVEEELKTASARGKTILGGKEGTRKKLWTEGGPPKNDPDAVKNDLEDPFEEPEEEDDDD